MAANTAMQGAYIPQYAHMQSSSVSVEVSDDISAVEISGGTEIDHVKILSV